MSQDFLDLADGGRRLAAVDALTSHRGASVAVVLPNGAPAGHAVQGVLGGPLVLLRRQPGDDVEFDVDGEVSGRDVIVVDDGVETGTAAMAVGAALRDLAVRSLVLAVPVCPREIEPRLRAVYDEVIAPVRPLARRSLHWHYERFEPLTLDEALALLTRD